MKELITIEGGAIETQEEKLSRAFADWVKFCDVGQLTQRAYNSAASKFVAFVRTGNLPLNQETLIKFREYCKENFSVSTARLYFTVCRKFCQWSCQKMNVADFTAGIKGVKLTTDLHARDALTAEDMATTINTFTGNDFLSVRNRLILKIAAECGLRRVELHRLDCADIELRRGKYFLKVWGKARAGKGDFVALPKELKKDIDQYLKMRAELMKNGEVDQKAPFFISVSNNSYGRRLDVQSFSKIAKKALVNAGLDSKRLVLHSFRHGFASAAINSGVDVRKIQKTLRHRSLNVTEIYIADENQFNNDATEIVAGKLNEFLRG